MTHTRAMITTLGLIFVLLAASATAGHKENAGTLIGAGTGALVGSQFGGGKGQLVGVAIGTLAGALMGRDVGRSLDRADHLALAHNRQHALEYSRVDQPRAWVNPDTGNSGQVTPVATYRSPRGQPCREYVQTVLIGGREVSAYGTACRQPDGSWKMYR